MCSHVTTAMAGLLACGSLPCVAFPVSQWRNDARLAAHSCGGSRSFRLEKPSLRSLLIPEGNHRDHHAWSGFRASMDLVAPRSEDTYTTRRPYGRNRDDRTRNSLMATIAEGVAAALHLFRTGDLAK